MNLHSTSLRALIASVWTRRQLTIQMARREILGRYRGSALGIFWSLLHPLLMLGVYTFVFAFVFRTRWPGAASDDRMSFALTLFAGMIVFGIFGECVQRAPGLIVSQPNFVKKVVFPLEIMPCVSLLAALFHAAISFGVLCVLLALATKGLHAPALLLPVVLLPLCMLCLGLGWLLSSLGVYVRDIGQIIGVAVTAIMFLSPMFYPSSALPERFRWISDYNPIACAIEQARRVLVYGLWPEWGALAAHGLAAFASMWLGFAWFQKTRRGFADVI